jgi:pimeloyl-ACP methyl ester carboxylesterase
MLAEMPAAALRIVTPDALTLAADIDGPSGEPVVVLLHGGGQTRHSWSGAMAALVARGYRVINYDARGHGDSDWSSAGAYHLDDRAADLEAVVRDLAVPFALVGASLGGATAIQAVARGLEPAVVVLVDIVPEPEPQGIGRIVGFMRGHPDGFASLDEAVDAVAAYNPDRPRPSDPSGLMRNLRQRPDGRLVWHWDPQIVADDPQIHHAEVRRSAEVLAARTEIPVMLVRGLRSDVVSQAGVAAFKALMPRLEVADVAEAGHMVAGDRNDAFNAAVLDVLDRRMPIPERG